MPVSGHWQVYETHSFAPISIGNGGCIAGGVRCGMQTSHRAASATAADGHSQPTAPARCDPMGSIQRISLVPQTATVNARVSGLIEEAPFQEGAIVHAGELLFRIDPRPFQADLDNKKAAVAQAKAMADQNEG